MATVKDYTPFGGGAPSASDGYSSLRNGLGDKVLFRSEAVAAKSNIWLGPASAPIQKYFTTSAIAIGLLLIGLFVFICTAEFPRKVRVPGNLTPIGGMIQIVAPQAGVVAALASEGDRIQPGDSLVHIDSERRSSSGNLTIITEKTLLERQRLLESDLKNARQEAESKIASLAARRASLLGDQDRSELEIDALKRRLQLSTQAVRRLKDLSSEGYVSDAQVQDRESERLDSFARLKSAERTLAAVARDIQVTDSEIQLTRSNLASTLSQTQRSLAALMQEQVENTAKGEVFVTAPSAGLVSTRLTQIGQNVSLGQPILNFILAGSGDEALQAQLYCPSKAIGLVKLGQRVSIRYQAFPFQKFGMAQGVVTARSSTPISPGELPVPGRAMMSAGTKNSDPVYLITVKIASQYVVDHGVKVRLDAGMALEADVVQENRTLLEWLFDPLFSAEAAFGAK